MGAKLVGDQTRGSTIIHDHVKVKPGFERALGSMRYFQASAIITLLGAVLLPIYAVVFLPPEATTAFFTRVEDALVSQPTTIFGYAEKFLFFSLILAPVFNLLLAGSLANLERPVSAFAAMAALAYILCSYVLITEMNWLWREMPIAVEIYLIIHVIAALVHFTVIGIVLLGMISLWDIPRSERDSLRDGFGSTSVRILFFRLLGLPAYTLHLGLRSWVVIPLFLLSSVFLAISLYPFFFAGGLATTLMTSNRNECMPLFGGLDCFVSAQLIDALFFPFLLISIFTVMFSAFVFTRRAARSLSIVSMRRLMRIDKRPPILFLRPFDDDQVRLPKSRNRSLFSLMRTGDVPDFFEHQVLEELTEIGPVIAIGDPGETGAPFGAARDFLPDEVWRQRVGELIDSSRLIVVALNDTPGVMWEVNEILTRNRMQDTLFIMPPAYEERYDRIWERFCQALELHRIKRPDVTLERRSVAGFFIAKDDWQISTTDHFTGTDSLILLRRFGTSHSQHRQHPTWSLARYPYCIAIFATLILALVANYVMQRSAATVETSSAIVDWEITPVMGPDSTTKRYDAIFIDSVAVSPTTGKVHAFIRNPEGGPALLTTISPSGSVLREIEIPVASPYPQTELRGRFGRQVSPLGLTPSEAGGLHLAQLIRDNAVVQIEILELSKAGDVQSHSIATPMTRFANAETGSFTQDGALVLAGQIENGDRRSPFLGKWNTNGTIAWSYNTFEGFGWGNDVALSDSGVSVFAVKGGDQWYVMGFESSGTMTFSADLPLEQFESAASKVLHIGSQSWAVAGTVKNSSERSAKNIPTLANLNESGRYQWIRELPGLEGSFISALAYHEGTFFLATKSGHFPERASAITILDSSGQVLETLTFTGNGSREISEILVAPDGALWIFGRAEDMSPNAPEIDRLRVPYEAWIVRLKKDVERQNRE